TISTVIKVYCSKQHHSSNDLQTHFSFDYDYKKLKSAHRLKTCFSSSFLQISSSRLKNAKKLTIFPFDVRKMNKRKNKEKLSFCEVGKTEICILKMLIFKFDSILLKKLENLRFVEIRTNLSFSELGKIEICILNMLILKVDSILSKKLENFRKSKKIQIRTLKMQILKVCESQLFKNLKFKI
uniref:Uncharacterized protein n=1 Tax=Romanomermis culicivorax TaxID=13658 RepID=A0A915J3P5_ROMCU